MEMQDQLLDHLLETGFLQEKSIENEIILHIITPCRFRIEEDIVTSLKKSYKDTEEIGGLLWAKPTIIDGSRIFVIERVSFIRNAIEDEIRNDGRNKSNAYLRDWHQYSKVMNEILYKEYLPVSFHTHPINNTELVKSLRTQSLQMETSPQDRLVSTKPKIIGTKKLLMPDCLIVGNNLASNDIFIGLYNGFISPYSFEESKKKILFKNYERAADRISTLELSDLQKVGIVIGALLLLFVIVKYRKLSLPVIISLATVISLMMNSTASIDNPDYFNKLSAGAANINIPEAKFEFQYI